MYNNLPVTLSNVGKILHVTEVKNGIISLFEYIFTNQ